jgi:hypothetical protein
LVVAIGGHLPQARTDGDQQIGIADAFPQFGIDADTGFADVIGMAIVEGVEKAEHTGSRQVPGLDPAAQIGQALRQPAGAAEHHQRALGRRHQRLQLGHLLRLRRRLHHLVGIGIGHCRQRRQHVLGQRQHHRARAS